jgi:serine/threonine protein kinase
MDTDTELRTAVGELELEKNGGKTSKINRRRVSMPDIQTGSVKKTKTSSTSSIHHSHARLTAWQQPMNKFINDQVENGNVDVKEDADNSDADALNMNNILSAASHDTAESTEVLRKAVDWMDNGIASLQAELDKSIRDRSAQLISMSHQSKSKNVINKSLQQSIRLKVHFRQTIRIVNVDDTSSFMQLKKRLCKDFELNTSRITLKYIDVDDDLITLTSQNDLMELFSLQMNTVIVHLIVAQLPSSPIISQKLTLQPLITNTTRNNSSDSSLSRISSSSSSSSSSESKNNSSTVSIGGNKICNWKLGEELGRGAFGRVYLGFNLNNGELMAVKKLDTKDMSQADLNETEKELKLLSSSNGTARLSHPNIVRYLGMERNTNSLCIFLEYVPGGSLKDLINKFGVLPEPLLRVYTRQILLGLEFLHERGVAHRDIKGGNVLITNEGVIKLADFGASKLSAGTITGQSILTMSNESGSSMESGSGLKGTPCWMSPEVIKGECKSVKQWQKADVWSLGCTVLEMANGKPPWSEFSNPLTAMYHIAMVGSTPTFPKSMSQEGLYFLSQCFERDVTQRPLITKLLQDKFVCNLPSTPTTPTTPTTPPRMGLVPITPNVIPMASNAPRMLTSGTLKHGIRGETSKTNHRWQHSFHLNSSKPPVPRFGHIHGRSKIRSPFVKKMPWQKKGVSIETCDTTDTSEILCFDNDNGLSQKTMTMMLQNKTSLSPLIRPKGARAAAASAQGEGFLRTDYLTHRRPILGSHDWVVGASKGGDTKEASNWEHQKKLEPTRLLSSAMPHLEALSWS